MIGLDLAEKMTGLDKLKLLAGILLVVALLGGAGTVGWWVNGWRLNAAHAQLLSEKDKQISDLTSKIQTQNNAVDILDEKSKNAIARRKLAEQYSQQLVNANNKREAVIEGSKATDCDSYVRDMWESW